MSLNEHHVFSAAYLSRPWLIDYWVHCCFQEGHVRVTLLARSTEYRRILNQAEVSEASATLLSSLCLSSSFLQLLLLMHPFLSQVPFLSCWSYNLPPLIYRPHLLNAYLKCYLL